MTSQEAKIIADFLVADYENEAQTTARVLGAVPADQSNYSPDAKSKSGLGLIRHIVVEDEWLLNSIADLAFAAPPSDGDGCGINTPLEGVERYPRVMKTAFDRVRAMSGEQLATVIDLFGMLQMPAVNFLSLAMKHSVHHRGQLSAYIRAMGGKVPGIYGPSGDTQQSAGA